MKCIEHKSHPELVDRVPDELAFELVNGGTHVYIPKAVYKAKTELQKQDEADAAVQD